MANGKTMRGEGNQLAEAEELRLAAVDRYQILDTPPDGAFDRIARLASKLLRTPISIISIVDSDRIWFKSREGLNPSVSEIPRSPGLCASAIMQDAPWILENAATHPASLANPLVAGDFGLRFYAGVPLKTPDGHNLGTLCVIDKQPREITADEVELLEELAGIVMHELELRREAIRAHAEIERQLKEKELLADEVEHRVMNSLQLVSSIARRRAAQYDGDTARELKDISARIGAIANANRHILHSLPRLSRDGNVKDFLEVLAKELFPLCPQGGVIELAAEDHAMAREHLVAVGHIITELVLNSVKQGASKITLTVRKSKGARSIDIVFTDDGPGLPEGFSPDCTRGLGMSIISAMARKLNASMDWGANPSGGAKFTFAVPSVNG